MRDQHRNGGFDLDPMADPLRWEALVGRVMTAAGPELERRQEDLDVAWVVLDWARPALAAAAMVALLMTTAVALMRGGHMSSEVELLTATVVPETFAAWLMTDYQPTVTELVAAVEGVSR